MSKRVAILLAEGFEEAEAVIVLDVLQRLGVDVVTVACQATRHVVSYHGLNVTADCLLSDVRTTLFDAVVLPGGPQGTVNLAASPQVTEFIREHDQAEKWICPLCSAAARVLGGNRLLRGRRYVCSGDLHHTVDDGVYVDAHVVEDGNLISGRGLGVAFDFAFYLAWRLTGEKEAINFQAEHIYYDSWRVPQ
ncbi:DJ-1 family protein [Chimaeribacter arupi]|uniref:DJ-1/PfpI family protein n=1 Tax=Chimaeribacter arupi TaxID=2060066 RepID=UPI000C7D97B0|nr:DJ-1/PfpI family protein [Chimaeribacter arupi]PLR50474.1 DJ-1 family protein [Chimaeribacter arupi]PLR54567.1 DJ-1 family protein [Chimaeribacter arupi]